MSLLPNTALVDFSREDIDMALRYGPGNWPGVVAVKLMDEEVFPVCSPRFNKGVLPKAPRDLAGLPLLRDARQPWSDWFKSIGLDLAEPARGPIYNEPSLVLQAAIAGQAWRWPEAFWPGRKSRRAIWCGCSRAAPAPDSPITSSRRRPPLRRPGWSLSATGCCARPANPKRINSGEAVGRGAFSL